MTYLIVILSRSGGGKSEVFEYLHTRYPQFFPMLTYTSRPPRYDGEGGYVFKDKDYFQENEHEFVELATYPPHSDPQENHVHYYGKHETQFDGKNYVMSMDEVGLLTLEELEKSGKLLDYSLISVFVDVEEAIRLERTNHDQARVARDLKRKFLPLDHYDYVFDNNGTKEELYAQVDKMIDDLISSDM